MPHAGDVFDCPPDEWIGQVRLEITDIRTHLLIDTEPPGRVTAGAIVELFRYRGEFGSPSTSEFAQM